MIVNSPRLLVVLSCWVTSSFSISLLHSRFSLSLFLPTSSSALFLPACLPACLPANLLILVVVAFVFPPGGTNQTKPNQPHSHNTIVRFVLTISLAPPPNPYYHISYDTTQKPFPNVLENPPSWVFVHRSIYIYILYIYYIDRFHFSTFFHLTSVSIHLTSSPFSSYMAKRLW